MRRSAGQIRCWIILVLHILDCRKHCALKHDIVQGIGECKYFCRKLRELFFSPYPFMENPGSLLLDLHLNVVQILNTLYEFILNKYLGTSLNSGHKDLQLVDDL